MGILLPTFTSLNSKLGAAGHFLKSCAPLVEALLKGFNDGFNRSTITAKSMTWTSKHHRASSSVAVASWCYSRLSAVGPSCTQQFNSYETVESNTMVATTSSRPNFPWRTKFWFWDHTTGEQHETTSQIDLYLRDPCPQLSIYVRWVPSDPTVIRQVKIHHCHLVHLLSVCFVYVGNFKRQGVNGWAMKALRNSWC